MVPMDEKGELEKVMKSSSINSLSYRQEIR